MRIVDVIVLAYPLKRRTVRLNVATRGVRTGLDVAPVCASDPRAEIVGAPYRYGDTCTLEQWNRLPGFNDGHDLREPPYLLIRAPIGEPPALS
ncbi:hypothetical protein C7401_14844 [Paraburkholderia unamae]|uniref:hypothetical protein n=1 Tax=Paraburkholderia unamae TaxID=219649 RepID=UPI000DC4251F|nr:hypothetical protein [Paraburkholderia unamae]RAR48861.1 hypothetical protein C7401_14844 [Paraburkholderia unamae]